MSAMRDRARLPANGPSRFASVWLAVLFATCAPTDGATGPGHAGPHAGLGRASAPAALPRAAIRPAIHSSAGKLVVDGVTALDLAKLAASAFGDNDDPAR